MPRRLQGQEPPQTSADIVVARTGTTFNVPLVRDFLFNGPDEWQKHRKIVEIMSQDPVFSKSERPFMTRGERYKNALAMTKRLYELKEIHGWSSQDSDIALDLLDENVPIRLHAVAFEPVILSQGSPTLIAKYGPLIATRGIIGCYAQTELGHGTNVSRLETTATYLSETQEFEIHSPTLTSRKWWIGAAGKTATHGVVQAKLILQGKDLGPHLFLVQFRALETHKVLPGIEVGDIGPKAFAGGAGLDNGYLKFDRIRIPRENMLSRFAQVSDDGQYVLPPHPKLSYGGMLYIRAGMVTAGGLVIAKAVTIALRYTTIRRQGENDHDGLERQVISYPSVYHRLLPILSHAYVYIQLGRNLKMAFQDMSSRLASGDISLLAEIHATTSKLKVLVTSTGAHDIEVARRCTGGHGFSAFAGLGSLYADYVPSTTYEGDNFVLDQQVVRAALKSYNIMLSSKRLVSGLLPSSRYLRLLNSPAAQPPELSESCWHDSTTLILLLEWRAARIVQELAQNQSSLDASVNQRVSKAVAEAFVAVQVGEMINNLSLGPEENTVISDLYKLYLLTTVEAALVDLFSFKLFIVSPGPGSSDPTRSLRLSISQLCRKLVPNAIGLSDAFAFTDWELDSALGVYDGNVYKALWDRAQAEPLNQREVPDGYEEFIKPVLQRGQRLAAQSMAKL